MEEININTKENASANSMFIVFANLIRDDDLNTMEMFPEEFLCNKATCRFSKDESSKWGHLQGNSRDISKCCKVMD